MLCRSGRVVVSTVLGVYLLYLGHVMHWYAVLCRSGRVVVSRVLGVFGRLSCWWQSDSLESKMMSLMLLMKLLLVDASVMSNTQHPAFTDIWAMYNGLLTDRATTLAFKVCHY